MNTRTTAGQAVNVATQDAELRCRVKLELLAAGYPSLREVAVTVHEGLVTLRGIVSCYYEKQVAQAAAMRVDAVESLRNDINVAL